jgi:pyroglutamyl-peptidase
MTTILITGFGRFPGAPFNPSAPLARAVGKRRRPAFADARRVVHIFETSYAAVDRELPKLMAQHRPDIVLMFGLAGRTPFVRIETRARNTRSVLFPDVTGYQPAEREIVPGRPPARRVPLEPDTHPPLARCRALSLQLRLLARAGSVPIRNAPGAVHSHPAGRPQAAAAGTQAAHLAGRAGARR